MELTPDERQRIYLEEKARIEDADEPAKELNQRGTLTSIAPWRVASGIGAALLFLGCFAPLMSAPFLGSINLIGTDRLTDGHILIALSVLAFAGAISAHRWMCWPAGLMAAFEAIHAIYLVSSSKPELTDKSGDGLAQTLSSITLGHLEVGWGVGLLAIGAMLCLLGPLVGKKSGVPS